MPCSVTNNTPGGHIDLGLHTIPAPSVVYDTARHIKMSVYHPRMSDAGGVFDQFGSYERAIYFQDQGYTLV